MNRGCALRHEGVLHPWTKNGEQLAWSICLTMALTAICGTLGVVDKDHDARSSISTVHVFSLQCGARVDDPLCPRTNLERRAVQQGTFSFELRDPRCGRLPHSNTSIALLDRRKTQRYLYRKHFPLFQTAEGEETTLERTQRHVMFDPVTRHSLKDGTASVQEKPLQGTNVSCSISHVGVTSSETRNDEIWTSRVQSTCVADGACTVSDNLSSCDLKLDSKQEIVVSRVLVSECVLVLSTCGGCAPPRQLALKTPQRRK